MAEDERSAVKHRLTEQLAYELWERRGRPHGSSEIDWFAAEKSLEDMLGYSALTFNASSTEPKELLPSMAR
jgi:hypothetical protein